MKLIKTYQLFNESISNDNEYYKQIPYEELEFAYDKYKGAPYKLNKNQKEILNKLVGKLSNGSFSGYDSVGNYPKIFKYDIMFIYGEDEYFYVEIPNKYANLETDNYYVYYKCDQFSGLIKLLKDKLPKNIDESINNGYEEIEISDYFSKENSFISFTNNEIKEMESIIPSDKMYENTYIFYLSKIYGKIGKDNDEYYYIVFTSNVGITSNCTNAMHLGYPTYCKCDGFDNLLKLLRLLRDNNTSPIHESYVEQFEEVTIDEYRYDMNDSITLRENEINEIENTFPSRKGESPVIVGTKISTDLMLLNIYNYNYNAEIYTNSDEYFFIRLGNTMNGITLYYKCDGFDGLMQCLLSIKNKYFK